MQDSSKLLLKLVATTLGTLVVILALYGIVFPLFLIETYLGLVFGVIFAAGVNFYLLKRAKKGVMLAAVGSAVTAIVVLCLYLLVHVNVFGS